MPGKTRGGAAAALAGGGAASVAHGHCGCFCSDRYLRSCCPSSSSPMRRWSINPPTKPLPLVNLQTATGAWKECAPPTPDAPSFSFNDTSLAGGGGEGTTRAPIITSYGIQCQLPLRYDGLQVCQVGVGAGGNRIACRAAAGTLSLECVCRPLCPLLRRAMQHMHAAPHAVTNADAARYAVRCAALSPGGRLREHGWRLLVLEGGDRHVGGLPR